MATRQTYKLRKLIYDTLNNDAALFVLLGNTGDRVRHGNPKSKSDYPLVCYNIITDLDEPYSPDVATGIVESNFVVQVFSAETSELTADAIEDRVYELLHGQNMYNNTEARIYSCYRVSRSTIYDPIVEVWRIDCKYKVVNATKP